jgi:hypothetical protein
MKLVNVEVLIRAVDAGRDEWSVAADLLVDLDESGGAIAELAERLDDAGLDKVVHLRPRLAKIHDARELSQALDAAMSERHLDWPVSLDQIELRELKRTVIQQGRVLGKIAEKLGLVDPEASARRTAKASPPPLEIDRDRFLDQDQDRDRFDGAVAPRAIPLRAKTVRVMGQDGPVEIDIAVFDRAVAEAAVTPIPIPVRGPEPTPRMRRPRRNDPELELDVDESTRPPAFFGADLRPAASFPIGNAERIPTGVVGTVRAKGFGIGGALPNATVEGVEIGQDQKPHLVRQALPVVGETLKIPRSDILTTRGG